MKFCHFIKCDLVISRFFVIAFCFLPTLLLAHPGHYHPDETDEFDTFQTLFFHSHGMLDYVLAAIVFLSIAVALISRKVPIKVSALATGVISAVLLPLL